MTLLNTITKNKRSLALITSVFSLLMLIMPVRALADGSGMVDPIYYTDGTLYPVVDYADLLTDEEEAELAAQIKAVFFFLGAACVSGPAGFFRSGRKRGCSGRVLRHCRGRHQKMG